MFNVRNRVGLGDFAPKSPCAKSTKSNPGSCRKSCTIGNLQMDGLVSSSGSPGCSKTPRPSDRAKQISRSMEKRSNSFPTATWPCSRSESDGRPHSHSKDRLKVVDGVLVHRPDLRIGLGSKSHKEGHTGLLGRSHQVLHEAKIPWSPVCRHLPIQGL